MGASNGIKVIVVLKVIGITGYKVYRYERNTEIQGKDHHMTPETQEQKPREPSNQGTANRGAQIHRPQVSIISNQHIGPALVCKDRTKSPGKVPQSGPRREEQELP